MFIVEFSCIITWIVSNIIVIIIIVNFFFLAYKHDKHGLEK